MKKKVAKVCFENLVNLCSKTNWNKDKLLLKAYNEIQSRVNSTKILNFQSQIKNLFITSKQLN